MATARHLDYPARPDVRGFMKEHGRITLVFALGFSLLVISAIVAARYADSTAGQTPALTGMEVDPPRALPALNLQRSDGTNWTADESDGRLAMFFFGYTNCPDVCPLTLSRAKQVIGQLGEDAALVDFYFVTVDPDRDTPERLGLYVSQFDPAITGLTGTQEQLEAATSAFGVVAEKVPTASGAGYAVDHTATSFLIDDGAIRLLYAHDTPADDLVSDLRVVLDEPDLQ